MVIIFQNKIRRLLKDDRGEANYFSTVAFIFIAVLLLAFIIDLFSIITTKQELDHCADQMVKQIQLSGGLNSETEDLFDFLCSQIEGADNISYSIDVSYKSPTPSGMRRTIQLGNPFILPSKGMSNWAVSGTSGWSGCESLPAAQASVSITGSEVADETACSTYPKKALQR